MNTRGVIRYSYSYSYNYILYSIFVIFRVLFQMDELQRENIQQQQEISELRCGGDVLALELKSSQDSVLQLEQQLQQKEELVCYNVVTMVPMQ